jgi:ubiquinone/menaquinone biosynthesis C-methylase UbiE
VSRTSILHNRFLGPGPTEEVVRQQYDQMAPSYDRRWSTYLSKTLSFLDAWMAISPHAVVLDIGCGTGEFERLVLNRQPNQQIIGVDISEKMLEIARQKCQAYPNVTFCTTSVSALPFSDHSFDVIVSASAFHYFDEPEAALKEARRVLRPGGILVILDWCKDYLFCRVSDMILKVVDPAYQRCYTQKEFHHLLNSARFTVQAASKTRCGLNWWGLMIATAAP